MFYARSNANCPVCKTQLGRKTKGEIATFLCEECQFWFTWDIDGKILKPQSNHVTIDNGCDCGSCKYRDEMKAKRQ